MSIVRKASALSEFGRIGWVGFLCMDNRGLLRVSREQMMKSTCWMVLQIASVSIPVGLECLGSQLCSTRHLQEGEGDDEGRREGRVESLNEMMDPHSTDSTTSL